MWLLGSVWYALGRATARVGTVAARVAVAVRLILVAGAWSVPAVPGPRWRWLRRVLAAKQTSGASSCAASTATRLLSLLAAMALLAAILVDHLDHRVIDNLVQARAHAACAYPYQGDPRDANEPQRTVGEWGDSISGQAGPIITALATQRCHTLYLHNKSGGAPCDAFESYSPSLIVERPSRVTLAWVGNSTTTCMMNRLKCVRLAYPVGVGSLSCHPVLAADATRPPARLSAAQIDAIGYWYEVDLRSMVRWNLSHNIRTYIELPPEMGAGTWHGQVNDELILRFTRVADAYGGVAIDRSVRDALSPGGVYRQTVVVNGVPRAIRYTDGTHIAHPVGQWLWAQAAITPLLLDR